MKYRLLSLLALSCVVINPIHAQNVILSELIYKIRNPETKADVFRESLEEIGKYMAIEVLEGLQTKEEAVETVLGEKAIHILRDEKPVLVTILRAGIPLFLGVQKIFPDSESGFLGSARNEETLKPKTDYVAIPDIEGKCVLLIDTMIATGGSILDAVKVLEKYNPKQIIVIGAIASKPGIANITAYNPAIKVYAAMIDPSLNEKGYIVPGLGDAGDRCYGLRRNS